MHVCGLAFEADWCMSMKCTCIIPGCIFLKSFVGYLYFEITDEGNCAYLGAELRLLCLLHELAMQKGGWAGLGWTLQYIWLSCRLHGGWALWVSHLCHGCVLFDSLSLQCVWKGCSSCRFRTSPSRACWWPGGVWVELLDTGSPGGSPQVSLPD